MMTCPAAQNVSAESGANKRTKRRVEEAAVHFERLKHLRQKVGTQDLKIACIALAHDATLLSRNVQDFVIVPGLRVENWLD